jgi:cleavage and polyadenylation specificity factor subunit 1
MYICYIFFASEISLYHIIGGARGVWSISVRQPVKVNGLSPERPVNPYQYENDSVIISTDANPSPGLSRVYSLFL